MDDFKLLTIHQSCFHEFLGAHHHVVIHILKKLYVNFWRLYNYALKKKLFQVCQIFEYRFFQAPLKGQSK